MRTHAKKATLRRAQKPVKVKHSISAERGVLTRLLDYSYSATLFTLEARSSNTFENKSKIVITIFIVQAEKVAEYIKMASSSSTSASVAQKAQQGGLETSASGIPKAPFIEDVEAHLGGPEEEAEPHLRKFQETMSKYKMMEMDRKQRQRALQDKIPDIEKTLSMVQHLQSKKVNIHHADV